MNTDEIDAAARHNDDQCARMMSVICSTDGREEMGRSMDVDSVTFTRQP